MLGRHLCWQLQHCKQWPLWTIWFAACCCMCWRTPIAIASPQALCLSLPVSGLHRTQSDPCMPGWFAAADGQFQAHVEETWIAALPSNGHSSPAGSGRVAVGSAEVGFLLVVSPLSCPRHPWSSALDHSVGQSAPAATRVTVLVAGIRQTPATCS